MAAGLLPCHHLSPWQGPFREYRSTADWILRYTNQAWAGQNLPRLQRYLALQSAAQGHSNWSADQVLLPSRTPWGHGPSADGGGGLPWRIHRGEHLLRQPWVSKARGCRPRLDEQSRPPQGDAGPDLLQGRHRNPRRYARRVRPRLLHHVVTVLEGKTLMRREGPARAISSPKAPESRKAKTLPICPACGRPDGARGVGREVVPPSPRRSRCR